MTMPNKPTDKQINALRKFKVPEYEISSMTFVDASKRLGVLINGAKQHDANPGLSNAGNKAGGASPNKTTSDAPSKTSSKEVLSRTLPPLPEPLTKEELDSLIAEVSDKYEPELASSVLFGRLLIIEQSFSIAMAKRISAQQKRNQGIVVFIAACAAPTGEVELVTFTNICEAFSQIVVPLGSVTYVIISCYFIYPKFRFLL
jgi:hypothetical protein